MFKVIIAGGRDFGDYDTLLEHCTHLLRNKNTGIEIVSGGARGADSLGEKYAIYKNYPIALMEADWDKHGKSAGYIRNSEMADYADALIAFWDGKSRGTKHMIDLAQKKGLQIRVVRYCIRGEE